VPEHKLTAVAFGNSLSNFHTRKNLYIAILVEENYLLETVLEHNKAMAPDAQEYPNP